MTIRIFLTCITMTLLLVTVVGCSKSSTSTVSEDVYVSANEVAMTEDTVVEEASSSGTDSLYTTMFESSLAQLRLPESGDTVVTLITNYGDIHLLMLPEAAPNAVENFVTHSINGYYDDLIFHRIIEDFMIQGGDPDGTGRGGVSIWGESFDDEFVVNYFPLRGTLAMANSGPATNGSQFFIVHSNEYSPDWGKAMVDYGFDAAMVRAYESLGGTPHLFNKHTVFGQVVSGMDVVDAIAAVEVGKDDKPIKEVVIDHVEVTIID